MSISKLQSTAVQVGIVTLGVIVAGLLMNKFRGDYEVVANAHAGFDSGL